MLEQMRISVAVRRRFASVILFACALGAALLLTACAGTTSARDSDPAVNAILDGTNPQIAGFTLAGQVTPVAVTPGPGTGNSNAPALFGGQIAQMTTDAAGTVWLVAGRAVHVTQATTINSEVGQPQVGAHVTVGGTPRADGGTDAAWVRVDEAAQGTNATGADAANDAVPGTGILTGTGVVSPSGSTVGQAKARTTALTAASRATMRIPSCTAAISSNSRHRGSSATGA